MNARSRLALALLVLAGPALPAAAAGTTILNASYDVTRELYRDIDPAFVAYWQTAKGAGVTVNQSHNGSTKQALAVANGLDADVVTFNQPPDIDILAEKGLVAKDWRAKFPNDAAPYTTTTVFLVRKGNPKGIKDWDDLVKPGTSVVIPNPKTSGNGRYSYLAAWGYQLAKTGSADEARSFVAALFGNVPVFEGGGRGATTTFTQREVGDVLVTFENEVGLVKTEFGDTFDVIYPSLSIEVAPPVAVVESVAAKRGTGELAKGYLDFLYGPVAQPIIARHGFRPRDPAAAQATPLPPIKTFKVEAVFGSWAKANSEHFAEGAIYDQITTKRP